MAKMRKTAPRSKSVMTRRPMELIEEDGMLAVEEKWTLKPIGNGIYSFLKERMTSLFNESLDGHAPLDPKIPRNTLEASYSSLMQGLIDIEENGGLDFDSVDEKGLLVTILERGSDVLKKRYARDLEESVRGKLDEREERIRRSERDQAGLSLNQKSLPSPDSESASRGGSDEEVRHNLSQGFKIRIPNSLTAQRGGGVFRADHKD